MVSIPSCHAGDGGSISTRGEFSCSCLLLSKSRRTKHQLVSFFQNYEIICKLAIVIRLLTNFQYVACMIIKDRLLWYYVFALFYFIDTCAR